MLQQCDRFTWMVIRSLGCSMAARVPHTYESCVYQKTLTAGLSCNQLGCHYTLASKEGDWVYNINETLYNDGTRIDTVIRPPFPRIVAVVKLFASSCHSRASPSEWINSISTSIASTCWRRCSRIKLSGSNRSSWLIIHDDFLASTRGTSYNVHIKVPKKHQKSRASTEPGQLEPIPPSLGQKLAWHVARLLLSLLRNNINKV